MEHPNVDKPYRWHGYFVVLTGAVVTILISGVAAASAVGANWPATVAVFVTIPLLLLLAYSGLRSLFAYHRDARHLAAAEAAYQPGWKRWSVAHVLTFGWLTSALYLFRRSRHVGNDYTDTYLERLPLFSSSNVAPTDSEVPTTSESERLESCPECNLNLAMGVKECQRCGWSEK